MGTAALGLLVLNLSYEAGMKRYALGLDAISFVVLFFLAVSLLGLLMVSPICSGEPG